MQLTELPRDEIKVALDAADVLIKFRAYLPPGGLLLMLVTKFRDDICDVIGRLREAMPQRSQERRSLDELTSLELDSVRGGVMILLQPRFTRVMDDPALPSLLREFQDALNQQQAERERLRAEMRVP